MDVCGCVCVWGGGGYIGKGELKIVKNFLERIQLIKVFGLVPKKPSKGGGKIWKHYRTEKKRDAGKGNNYDLV